MRHDRFACCGLSLFFEFLRCSSASKQGPRSSSALIVAVWCLTSFDVWITTSIKALCRAPILASCELIKQHLIRDFNHIPHFCTIFLSAWNQPVPVWLEFIFNSTKQKLPPLKKSAGRWKITAEEKASVRELKVCALKFTVLPLSDKKRSSYTSELLSGQIGSIQDTQPPPRYCW